MSAITSHQGQAAIPAGIRTILVLAVLALLVPVASVGAAQTRVVGGSSVANPGWIALVEIGATGGTQECTGDLVARSWVLTAGHCATNQVGAAVANGSVKVWVGPDRVSQTNQSNAQTVDRVVINPDYDPNTAHGDLALLHLAAPDSHTPVALGSSPGPAPGTSAQVLGFGVANAVFDIASDTLQQISTPILEASRCQQQYPKEFDASSMICAGATYGQDSCGGDSGGPLVVRPTTGAATLLGTVDLGSELCGDGTPSVYQRVAGGPQVGFLATTIPTAIIGPSQALSAAETTIRLTGVVFNLTGPIYHWDLNDDGVYDDAVGTTVAYHVGSQAASVGVRVDGTDGEQAARRLTITPTATTLNASVPDRVHEGHALRVRLSANGPGAGSVVVRVRSHGVSVARTVQVPSTKAFDIALPNDHVWQAPRKLTVTVSGDAALTVAEPILTSTMVDDDAPRLVLSSKQRDGAFVVRVRPPGKGTVVLNVRRAGKSVASRRLTVSSTTVRTVHFRASVSAGPAVISGRWTSSEAPKAHAKAEVSPA